MKYIKLVLLFVISNTVLGQNKIVDTLKYEIFYNYKYQINKEDTLNIQTEKMVLKIGKNVSEFLSYNEILAKEDAKEREKAMELSGMVGMRKAPKAKIFYRVIKDNNSDEMLFFHNFAIIRLYYSLPINQFSWALINEEKEILGYKCKKATTTFSGREYVAWYSIDLPLSDGPYKFQGLPGLILSISDSKNHHSFEVIGIKKINEFYNLDYDKHVKVSKNEYLQTVKKIKEKPSLMALTDMIQFPKEMLDKIDKNGKEKFKYENNPIELID
ncbi:MAG: GLPGLI family protein [Flavobacterium sp.]|nr:GLPGLI family protein [Flavobacterium sp.]